MKLSPNKTFCFLCKYNISLKVDIMLKILSKNYQKIDLIIEILLPVEVALLRLAFYTFSVLCAFLF